MIARPSQLRQHVTVGVIGAHRLDKLEAEFRLADTAQAPDAVDQGSAMLADHPPQLLEFILAAGEVTGRRRDGGQPCHERRYLESSRLGDLRGAVEVAGEGLLAEDRDVGNAGRLAEIRTRESLT